MKRAIGYCLKVGSIDEDGCEDYAKGTFLLNHLDTYYCARCRTQGVVIRENGIPEPIEGHPFKEVRVEYNFDITERRFREIAIVRDDSIHIGGRYTLMSPLIKTEKRALKVAEAILGNLQQFAQDLSGDGVPRTTETILSFDDPRERFDAQVAELGSRWEKSALTEPVKATETHALFD